MKTPIQSESIQGLGRLLHLHLSEVWIRFLLAIVGLILAFAAALFSTVSRESGNVWATLILASAALLLATIVGVTTVPYLARRVVAARIRDAFHYDVTRGGIIYIVITMLIGIAALNTGNNLLYIVVAAMLAAILVSGVASAMVLRDLELDIHLAEHVFAGRPVIGRMLLRNTARRLPSFSIRIVPSRPPKSRWWRKDSNSPGRPANQSRWLCMTTSRVPRTAAPNQPPHIFEQTAYFPFIPARTEANAEMEMLFPNRGRYQESGFGIATRFPFAFLAKTRQVPLARELVVYPPVQPTDDFFEVLPMITGEFESFVRGRGHDLYRIREYMPEDSARYVDWKATAKSGSLKLREFSREDERRVRIIFDNPKPGLVSAAAYERAVILAASLTWHFSSMQTDMKFLAQNFQATDPYLFLRYLGLVQPADGPSVFEKLTISGDYNLIFTARAHGTIPTPLWSCSYFLFIDERGATQRTPAVQQKSTGMHPTQK
ncbi:MAG TPA: DUF58 domain-containing protein [Terriglobales bacterium]|nr:DUF58 domain-containing protein [Terriglobales bacterium]